MKTSGKYEWFDGLFPLTPHRQTEQSQSVAVSNGAKLYMPRKNLHGISRRAVIKDYRLNLPARPSLDQILAIRTFVRVADAGSFAKAADTLNLPRSSVSKLVQDLEAHLGAKLVERTTRSVTMTTEGIAYHERAPPPSCRSR